MATEAAFVKAILAEPDDEPLRLIFADWLEERGDPRGEFIRVQCELAHQPSEALILREAELLLVYGPDWAGPIADIAEEIEFYKGFVDKVTLTPQAFLDDAELLFELAPIRHVHFYRRNHITTNEVAELMLSPHLGRLAGFQLNSDRGICDHSVGILASSRRLSRLACLDLSNNWITNDGARLLAESPHLDDVRTVRLERNPIGKTGKTVLRQRFGDRLML